MTVNTLVVVGLMTFLFRLIKILSNKDLWNKWTT